jgi:folylpolyglutamate synthase/dihydropteroate synthase
LERAGPQDVVFATGSLYLVGELRSYWSTRAAKQSSASRPNSSSRS